MTHKGSLFYPGASDALIAQVRTVLPLSMPEDYFGFLRRCDGCEVGFHEEDPAGFDCIQIYSCSEILEFRATHLELFPALAIIGSDGGSQHLAYDLTAPEPCPLVIYLPGYGQTPLASTLSELAEKYLCPGEGMADAS